jgi:hypothetical protein
VKLCAELVTTLNSVVYKNYHNFLLDKDYEGVTSLTDSEIHRIGMPTQVLLHGSGLVEADSQIQLIV